MNEKELASELSLWFKNIDKDKNFWTRNCVAKVLKSNLLMMGNFKNKTGGTRSGCSKGFRKMRYVLACKNGYDGEFLG